MANSDVKLKHKVQLRKKVEEPEVSVNKGDIEPAPTPEPERPKSKLWLWLLLGIVVLGGVGYMFFPKSGDKVAETPEQEIEAVAESSVPADIIAAEGTDIEEADPNDGNAAANTSEPKGPEAVETTATADNTSNVSSSTQLNESNVSNDVEAEAMKVIRGDYGIGQERKDKLGSKYQTIQSRVNELKREGIF